MTDDIGDVQSIAKSTEAVNSTGDTSFESIPQQGGGAVSTTVPPASEAKTPKPSLFAELTPTASDARYLTALGVDANCRALRTLTAFFGTVAKEHAASLAFGHTPAWLDVVRGRQVAVRALFTQD